MRKASWLSAAVLIAAACQSHETPQQMQARMDRESDSLRTAATAIARRWEAWSDAGQADSLASVFTDQGREMPPNEAPVVGHAAIKRFEAGNAAMFASKLTITGEAWAANGPLGVERGSFTFSAKAKPGAPKGVPATINDEGKYLIHWQNVNGQWQMAEIIWNSSKPMMMPAPAKKPAKPAAKKTAAKKK